jgi:hypothetical protein
MIQQVRRSRRRLLGAGLLFGLAIGAWWGFRWLSPEPGSLEDGFARIRLGMSRDEAVSVLRTCDPYNIDGVYSEGTTKQGRSWAGTKLVGDLFDDLPPPQEIAHCVLGVSDNDGREVEIVLGAGGIVSGKHLSPGVWQYRVHEAYRVLTRAAADLVSRSWWGEQLHKTSRSIHRRRRYALPCLGVVLLLVSAWVLRRRRVRYGVSRAEQSAAADNPRE